MGQICQYKYDAIQKSYSDAYHLKYELLNNYYSYVFTLFNLEPRIKLS